MNSIIKARRIELGMSTEEVARKLNVAKSTIYRYEGNGFNSMNVATLGKLAAIYETSPLYLLGLEEKEPIGNHVTETIETPAPLTKSEKEEVENYAKYLVYKRKY